jgi:hypothetical protein
MPEGVIDAEGGEIYLAARKKIPQTVLQVLREKHW